MGPIPSSFKFFLPLCRQHALTQIKEFHYSDEGIENS